MFLTLTQIKKHLNLESTFTDDDEYLTLLAESAEDIVQKHIDNKFENLLEYGALPKPLLNAMLLFIGNLYANRESVAYVQTSQVPKSYDYLLDAYKNWLGVDNTEEAEPVVYYGTSSTFDLTNPDTVEEIKAGSKMFMTTTITALDTNYPRVMWIAYKTSDASHVKTATTGTLNSMSSIVDDYTVKKYYVLGGSAISCDLSVTIG